MASASPWIAVEAGADPVAWARALRQAHERYFAAGAASGPGGVRPVIGASWRRSARAGVQPDRASVEVPDTASLEERRANSSLEPVLPVLRELLAGHAREARHLMIVTDPEGRLLWVEGDRVTRGQAEAIGLVPGAPWSEAAAGTNAMGTAIAVDHCVQVFAAEHVLSEVHDWTCAAAPLHHPVTGRLMGCVDLTGPARTVHPHSLGLVTAAARTAELLLPRTAVVPAAGLRLRALGRDNALLEAGGRELRLSRRHSEIAVLLALHPEGLTAEQLALELFGEDGKPVSVRAELSRLRRLLGPALDAQPYRLALPVEADFEGVQRLLDAGRPGQALRAYGGPLLPSSDAPGIRELRRGLDAGVRGAVLASGDDALLRAWLESQAGRDDLPAMEILLRRRPGDPALAAIGRRAARLRLT